MTSKALEQSLLNVNKQKGTFQIHRDAYKSQEVFEKERDLIFDKCWLYLGHQSELPKKGDFLTRTVMGRNLIFQRTRKGELVALYNACTHRGAAVCWDKKGNGKNHSCRYHGWVFDTEGKLKSMNAETGYPDDINDDGHLDLPRARLEGYGGLYFVNFNDNAISLHDFLGQGARDLLDAMNQQTSEEMIVMPGEHAYTINANYKFLIENSADGYHVGPVHQTYMEFLADRYADTKDSDVLQKMASYEETGVSRAIGNGHYVLSSNIPTGRPVGYWLEEWGLDIKKEIDANRQRLTDEHGKEHADYICDMQKNAVIFPNLVVNDILALTIRVIEPISATKMKVNSWCLAPSEESEELKAIRLDNFVSFLGPTGFGSPDDGSMLNSAQISIQASPTEWTELSKGVQNVEDLRIAQGGTQDETHMQGYWTQWDLMMTGKVSLDQ